MYQPAPGHPYVEPCITAMGQCLPVADNFTYLGSTLSRSVVIDTEINSQPVLPLADSAKTSGTEEASVMPPKSRYTVQ